MIARLNGVIVSISLSHLIVDVNGVGYLVNCTTHQIKKAKIDEPVILYIETVIREDAFLLYGFESKIEQDWFQLLTNKVQGIGAKSAISMLSTLTLSELATAIQNSDVKTISRAPGVGPKVAQRVIAELKGKLPEGDFASHGVPSSSPVSLIASEAIQSLVSLGFEKTKADKAIRAAVDELGDEADIASLIRIGLSKTN